MKLLQESIDAWAKLFEKPLTSEQLDKWAELFGLPRKDRETDDDLKSRIMLYLKSKDKPRGSK